MEKCWHSRYKKGSWRAGGRPGLDIRSLPDPAALPGLPVVDSVANGAALVMSSASSTAGSSGIRVMRGRSPVAAAPPRSRLTTRKIILPREAERLREVPDTAGGPHPAGPGFAHDQEDLRPSPVIRHSQATRRLLPDCRYASRAPSASRTAIPVDGAGHGEGVCRIRVGEFPGECPHPRVETGAAAFYRRIKRVRESVFHGAFSGWYSSHGIRHCFSAGQQQRGFQGSPAKCVACRWNPSGITALSTPSF